MENNKALIDLLWQYGHYFVISIVFGIGKYIHKVKENIMKLNCFDFFSELLFALMAGYITFRICLNYSLNENLTAIMIAIASYSGSKFLDSLQKITIKFIAKKLIKELEGIVENKEEEKP